MSMNMISVFIGYLILYELKLIITAAACWCNPPPLVLFSRQILLNNIKVLSCTSLPNHTNNWTYKLVMLYQNTKPNTFHTSAMSAPRQTVLSEFVCVLVFVCVCVWEGCSGGDGWQSNDRNSGWPNIPWWRPPPPNPPCSTNTLKAQMLKCFFCHLFSCSL